MAKEKVTDIIIARLLKEADIDFTPEESQIKVLKTASKRDTGRKGFLNLAHEAVFTRSIRARMKNSQYHHTRHIFSQRLMNFSRFLCA